MSAQEQMVANESFGYRGNCPMPLVGFGEEDSQWKSGWARYNNALPPVWVDTFTLNNPFGSGGASHRASNGTGKLGASKRELKTYYGQRDTRTTVEFAMMERFSASQKGLVGGVQLLNDDKPVLFAGFHSDSEQLLLADSFQSPTRVLATSTLERSSSLYRVHFIRVVIDTRDVNATATLEAYDMYGLPTMKPVQCTAPSFAFNTIAVALDDHQVDEIVVRNESRIDRSPIHYRPALPGRLADTIPFYWNGEYHIFYLRAVGKVPWEHIVSNDFIHWRDCPTALVSDGKPDSADGLNMFTGSVIEKDGVFHLFYTGWNPNNPEGREFVMHAISRDLMTWTKNPEDQIRPDGKLYGDHHDRDFRDPYVYRDAKSGLYKMLLCTGSETGLAASSDLIHWAFEKPLNSNYENLGTPECPDYFEIAGHRYLLVSPTRTDSTIARYSLDSNQFLNCEGPAIDTPFLYAAKRLFDGKKHIVTGWIRDLEGEKDSGAYLWGGTQSVPRELYVGDSPNRLLSRPIPAAREQYTTSALDKNWVPETVGLKGNTKRIKTPENYWMRAVIHMEDNANPRIVFRDRIGSGESKARGSYRLEWSRDRATLATPYFQSSRSVSAIQKGTTVVEAFVQGTIIECFINDAYAFSCRAYDSRGGDLCFETDSGTMTIESLQIKTATEAMR